MVVYIFRFVSTKVYFYTTDQTNRYFDIIKRTCEKYAFQVRTCNHKYIKMIIIKIMIIIIMIIIMMIRLAQYNGTIISHKA